VPVHSVAPAEDSTDRVVRGVLLVDVPHRLGQQLDVKVGVADQRADLLDDDFVGEVRLAGGHVEAPAGDPLVPRLDGSEQAHTDLTEPGFRIHDPVEDAGPVGHVPAQVSVEQDVGGAGAGQLTLERQSDLLRDS
jgi:predicted acyltransferase (DUF342 family)